MKIYSLKNDILKNKHPYFEVDLRNGTNFFNKFIGGSYFKISGNKKYQYDFEINGNNIFLGKGNQCCFVSIENKKANIVWFVYHKYCSVKKNLSENQGTKHMFYHLMKVILENFPDVEYFGLGDDTKITCKGNNIELKYYYFLKYGKLYYQLYFNFNPAFRDGNISKEKYIDNLKIREKIKITKEELLKIYQLYSLTYPTSDNEIRYFLTIFDENIMLVIHFLNKISKEYKVKYCLFFYFLTKHIFINKFHSSGLPQTFILEKNELAISYLNHKISII